MAACARSASWAMTSSDAIAGGDRSRGRRPRPRAAGAPPRRPSADARRAARRPPPRARTRRRASSALRGASGRRSVNVLPTPGALDDADLAAEQARDLAADRQARARCRRTCATSCRRPAGRPRRSARASRRGSRRRCRSPRTRACRPAAAAIRSVTEPRWVNLTALESRLRRICCRRCSSVTIAAGSRVVALDREASGPSPRRPGGTRGRRRRAGRRARAGRRGGPSCPPRPWTGRGCR